MVIETSGGTAIYGNTEHDALPEFHLLITDGPGTHASDYTSADFIL